jgi:hypothetical protein
MSHVETVVLAATVGAMVGLAAFAVVALATRPRRRRPPRAPRAHAVRLARPNVPPHVLGADLTPSELGDDAPTGTARIVAPSTAPPMPSPPRGKFLTPAEIRARVLYFRRWGSAPPNWSNRRQMRAEYRALKAAILLARFHEASLRGGLKGALRNRAWVADETRQVERDLMAAMSVALPRGADESREAWEARRRAMLATWRDEPATRR